MQAKLAQRLDDARGHGLRAFRKRFVQHDGAEHRAAGPAGAQRVAQRGGEHVAGDDFFFAPAAALRAGAPLQHLAAGPVEHQHGKLQAVAGVQQRLRGLAAAVAGVGLQDFDDGAQRAVVALAAIVAQAFGAQLGLGAVQFLQALVHHGARLQLQVAAGLEVHALERVVELGNALFNVGHLRSDAVEQRVHALL